MSKPFIIADIGSNFRGSKEIAFKQIELAKKTGCDAAKFQLYSHEELYGYPGEISGALSREWLHELKACADQNGIEFMCTPFSVSGVEVLNPLVKRHKIASSDFKDWQIWKAMELTGKPIIASTGAAHSHEIAHMKQYQNAKFLECVASYPATLTDYRFFTLGEYKLQGISDHTMSNAAAIIATDLGAEIFEHHFDAMFDELPKTPDSCVSFSLADMTSYVSDIRRRRELTCDGIKRPWRSEDGMQLMYRKRIVANRFIEKGGTLKLNENFGFFRVKIPDTRGAPPEMWKEFDGKIAKVSLVPGTPIWVDDIF